MRFVVIFDDSTEMAEVRNRLEPDHLRYLEVHHAEIPMAGGLKTSTEGAMWVACGYLKLPTVPVQLN